MQCKILKTQKTKAGTTVLIQLPSHHEISEGSQLLLIDPKAHYKLGDPIDEVLSGDILTASREVTWDNAEQEWLDVHS